MELVTMEDVIKLFKSEEAGRKSIELHREWFPLISSPHLAGIVADLMGDGHLQGSPKWRLDFTSKHLEELERFNNQIFSLFGIRGKTRPCTTNRFGKTFNLGINCKPLARSLKLVGVPTGSKVLQEFLIPEWIMIDKECFRVFVRRLFDCEGFISVEGKNSCIEICMWKSLALLSNSFLFFNQIKEGLEKFFGIHTFNLFLTSNTNQRKDSIITRGVRLKIKKLVDLIKFSKEIGFETNEKQKKLNSIIEIKLMGQNKGQ